VAVVAVVKEGGRECVKIRLPDESKVEEVATMLKAVGDIGVGREARSKCENGVHGKDPEG